MDKVVKQITLRDMKEELATRALLEACIWCTVPIQTMVMVMWKSMTMVITTPMTIRTQCTLHIWLITNSKSAKDYGVCIISVTEELTVTFMTCLRSSGACKRKFVLPIIEDQSQITLQEVIAKLPMAAVDKRGHYVFPEKILGAQ